MAEGEFYVSNVSGIYRRFSSAKTWRGYVRCHGQGISRLDGQGRGGSW